MNPALIAFHSGTGKDCSGRTLASIIASNDEWLEATHTWIQMCFPTPEPSKFNPGAPIADAETYEALANLPAIKALGLMDEVFERFIVFLKVKPFIDHSAVSGEQVRPAWWKLGNHNHLRVARTTRCLDLMNTTHHTYLATVLRLAIRKLALLWPDGCSNANLAFWRVLILGREDA